MENSFFVSLEGVDKTGKTIIHEILKTKIPTTKALYISDPTKMDPWDSIFKNGINFGDIVKEEDFNSPKIMNSFLLLTARIHCFHEKIIDSLKDNYPVIADRYADSWIAYQSVYQKEYFGSISDAYEFFKNIHELCLQKGLLANPDITIFIRITESELRKRLERTENKTQYEKDSEKLLKVQEIYEKLSKEYSNRYRVIDDNGQGIISVYKEVEENISEIDFLEE